jgi:ribosomal protein L37AE/L43A
MGAKLTAEFSKQLGFSFNTRLGKNLSMLKNAVMNQDFDAVILVDGAEGAGKSVFGLQIAYFLDKDNSIDLDTQVCWYPEQVKEAILSLEKGKAIVWDEARRGLNRRRSTQQVNLEMTDLFAECRQHNLFLIVIMPTFYDMDMNIAVWRSRALIHVWFEWDKDNPEKPLKRGFFRFYNELGKKGLYVNKFSRQSYNYPHLPNKSFDATFVKHYVVDEVEYRRRKRESEEKYNSKKGGKPVCGGCGSADVRYLKKDQVWQCYRCPWNMSRSEYGKTKGRETGD